MGRTVKSPLKVRAYNRAMGIAKGSIGSVLPPRDVGLVATGSYVVSGIDWPRYDQMVGTACHAMPFPFAETYFQKESEIVLVKSGFF